MRPGAPRVAVFLGLLSLCAHVPVRPATGAPVREHVVREAVALTDRGRAALARGDLRRAERRFDEAIALLPSLPEPYVGLGHVGMQRRRFHEALGRFREAERLFLDQSEEILRWRAERGNRERTEAAKLHQRRAILQQNIDTLEGMTVEASGRKARRQTEILNGLRADVQRLDGRIRVLEERAESAEPDLSSPPGRLYFFIGNALLRLERLDEAVEAWQVCTRLEPAFALAWNNLAVAYWKLGDARLARAHLDRAKLLGFRVSADLDEVLANQSAEE